MDVDSKQMTAEAHERSAPAMWLGMIGTAACAVLLTLVIWVLLVSLLSRRFLDFEHAVWSATLWSSALFSSALVASSRRSVRPVLSCTVAFGLFGLVYMMAEGPIFGVVSEGGDPTITQVVVWNLASLPFGVFAATEFGRWLGRRRDRRTSKDDRGSPES